MQHNYLSSHFQPLSLFLCSPQDQEHLTTRPGAPHYKTMSTQHQEQLLTFFGCLSNSQAHELMQCLQTFVAQPQSADSQAQSLLPAAPPLEIQPASKDDKVPGTPPTSPTSHGQEEENDRTTQDELSAAKWHWWSNEGWQQLHDGSMHQYFVCWEFWKEARCEAKKIETSFENGQTEIILQGTHNHAPPLILPLSKTVCEQAWEQLTSGVGPAQVWVNMAEEARAPGDLPST